MKPTLYNFPDGYAHGLKKEDFMDLITKNWVHGESNYDDAVWEEYESLGGEVECNEDSVIIDYDLDLYDKAQRIVLSKYLYDDTAWKEDYWKDYLDDYEYPYFIGEVY